MRRLSFTPFTPSTPFALFRLCALFALVLFFAGPFSSARAAITVTGNVSPANPSTWTSSTTGYIGNTAAGTLTDNGSRLLSSTGYIGYGSGASGVVNVSGTGSTWTNGGLYVGNSGSGTLNITGGGAVSSGFVGYVGNLTGSIGAVTVNGPGSTWTNSSDLYVGNSGNGTLNITNRAAVTVGGATYVASNAGSTGTINFGTNGGTLTTNSLLASPSQLTGTGTVNTHGLVSDLDLVFDATHGLTRTLTLNSQGAGQNVTVNLTQNSGGALGAGYMGNGSLTIRDGIVVNSGYGYLGYRAGSNGVATVDGAGSAWNNASDLYVGLYGGNGTLNIANGGSVSVAGATCVAFIGGTGTINFGPNGGTLATQSLYASPTQLAGAGTINARGLVSDVDLVFNPTHGLTRTLTFNGQGQNVVVNLDLSGSSGVVGDLGVGYLRSGSLTIQGGIAVASTDGLIGYQSGSTGIATVSGAGSTWTNTGILCVGFSGNGTLNITKGGVVSDTSGYIGFSSGSSGVVTVDGTGSIWTTNSGFLFVGDLGSGTLNITNGGSVTASILTMPNGASLLAMDIGHGSSLIVGELMNINGLVRLSADANVAVGTYTPISAGFWPGSGSYQAIGGTWNANSHQFNVSAAATGTVGSPVTFDLASTQRVLFSDNTGKNVVGASFAATTTSTSIGLTAAALSDSVSALLQTTAGGNETILSGWTFSTTGYTVNSSNPAYLSLLIGSGQTLDNLDVWHFDGTTWTEYATTDLSYDGSYASFTVTGFSGYAITEAVPEPGTLALLIAGLLGLLAYAWRKRQN
jgi:T5SS/PEP-CTERM-associated repeat protein